MTLGEKLRHLRYVEGMQRGLDRPLTKAEVTRLMRAELGPDAAISLAYLSQLESGTRQHMTQHTRARLAAFFRVLPGYLVNDPAGYETELHSLAALPTGNPDERLVLWLNGQADASRDHPLVAHVLRRLAHRPRPHDALRLIDALLDLPEAQLTALASQLGVATTLEAAR